MNESKTPRTDAFVVALKANPDVSGCDSAIDFARQLETELAAMTAERDAIKASCQVCLVRQDALALVEEYRKERDALKSMQCGPANCAMVTSLTAELDALVKENEWHLVSELPAHGDHVLAINANGEMWIDFWYYHEARWFNAFNGNHEDMTHWRELPQPPKEEPK